MWDRQAEGFRSFEVDREVELVWMLDRDAGGWSSAQNLVRKRSRSPERLPEIRAVADQPANLDVISVCVDRGHPMFQRGGRNGIPVAQIPGTLDRIHAAYPIPAEPRKDGIVGGRIGTDHLRDSKL